MAIELHHPQTPAGCFFRGPTTVCVTVSTVHGCLFVFLGRMSAEKKIAPPLEFQELDIHTSKCESKCNFT